jgi:hypothetical protein
MTQAVTDHSAGYNAALHDVRAILNGATPADIWGFWRLAAELEKGRPLKRAERLRGKR